MRLTGTFIELTLGQRQTYQAAVALHQDYLAAVSRDHRLKGGMHWKKIGGREYLYRYRDRLGHGRSLGPRSERTEKIFGDFVRARREVNYRLRDLRLRLAEQARFCRAALIHRLPQTPLKIMRRLELDQLGGHLLILGAAALCAYEFAAGVFLPGADGRLTEARRRLDLAGDGSISWTDLLQLLRRGDRSFAPLPGAGCRAVNRDGFQVRLFKTDGGRPGRPKTVTAPGARQPLPPEAGQLHYLLTAPKFSQVVIGQDGGPVTLTVPDPRAFALNRLWLSQQEDREPAQRALDLGLALAVAALVLRYLPQYDFSESELDMFPRELGREGEDF